MARRLPSQRGFGPDHCDWIQSRSRRGRGDSAAPQLVGATPEGDADAHRRGQHPAHPDGQGHADGRAAPPLLAPDRGGDRVRGQVHQAGAPAGRGPRPLQGPLRHLRPARAALPAPPRRPLLRLRRGVRASLQLPRLGLRREGQLPCPALRGHGQRQHALSRRDQAARLPRPGDGRAALCLPRPDPPRLPVWEPFDLQERLRPDRPRAARLQLAAGRGEQHRPGALRVAARQLVGARPAGRDTYGPKHLQIDVDEWDFGFGYKRILENTDRDQDANWTRPAARTACRTSSCPAARTSSTASRSTTPTRSRSSGPGPARAARVSSPTSKSASRTGTRRSPTR